MLGSVPVQRVFRGTNLVWANEVVVTLGNVNNVVLKSLFTLDDWNNPNLKKRVVVPAGVQIGATSSAFAIQTSVQADGQAGSWAGDLTLEIAGTVSGIGAPPNSGVGGNAIRANFPGKAGQKLKLFVSGTLRSGGGGGGLAGNGGAGNYVERDPTSGDRYEEISVPRYYWGQQTGWAGDQVFFFYGYNITAPNLWVTALPINTTSYTTGGWTYRRGNYRAQRVATTEGGNNTFTDVYGIYRERTLASSGGIAGAPGRGQGFDGAATAGAAAVPGGTNAGASGKSGDGGGWGASGQAGAAGANGNVGSGTAGASGGLAGFYIEGIANVDLTNSGTLQGRVG